MRILLAGTSYIRDENGLWLAKQWARICLRLNPDCDVLVVDSASPYAWPEIPGLEVVQLGDNIGHLGSTGRDGWGRAFSRCLTTAIERGHDYVATLDADVIFTRPVRPLFERMRRHGVRVASTFGPPYQWLEGINFFEVAWLRETQFVERYDWQASRFNEYPERRVERLIGESLFLLPLRGLRDDGGWVHRNTMSRVFPFGCDYLTHCKDMDAYQCLMEMHGLAE